MINFDKFLASFITEMKKYTPITSYNIPACIKKALEDQGLEYRDGEIVKTQDIIAIKSEDERIRKLLISGMKNLNHSAETFASVPIKDIIDWLEKQGQNPTWSEEDDMMLECVLDKIGDLGTGVMCKGWLKSLKNRIKGE